MRKNGVELYFVEGLLGREGCGGQAGLGKFVNITVSL